jgi:hypothetical protein
MDVAKDCPGDADEDKHVESESEFESCAEDEESSVDDVADDPFNAGPRSEAVDGYSAVDNCVDEDKVCFDSKPDGNCDEGSVCERRRGCGCSCGAIFVRFFQDGFTSAQFTFYILHISFQFSIFLLDFFSTTSPTTSHSKNSVPRSCGFRILTSQTLRTRGLPHGGGVWIKLA